MIRLFFVFLNAFLLFAGNAQIVSGPMLGQVELRDAKIWLEVDPYVKKVQLLNNKKGDAKTKTVFYNGLLGKEFNPVQFTLDSLDFNTTYEYRFLIDGKEAKQKGSFTTKDL